MVILYNKDIWYILVVWRIMSKLIVRFGLTAFIIAGISCLSANPNSGCTDPVAVNFDNTAMNDDGSCEFPDNGNFHSLLFDGVYDWVLAGNGYNLLNIQNAFSITAHIKVKDDNTPKFIFDGESTESEHDSLSSGFSLMINEEGQLQGFVGGGTAGGSSYITTDSPVQFNRWQYVAFTRDGSTAKLYINSELVSSNENFIPSDINFNGDAYNTDEYLIGHYSRNGDGYAPTQFFNGNIGDVKVYARSIHEIETQAEMEGYVSLNALRGQWKFNAGDGDLIFDHTGNGNHGAIVQAKWVVHEPVQLNDGNNLISFPGYFLNDNTQMVLNEINADGANTQFLIGFWVGIFNYDGVWSGNLNHFSPYSGYWLNNEGEYAWDVQMDRFIDNCETYPVTDDNNMISFRWGQAEHVPTLDALGGNDYALEHFNFIIGNGVGLFKTEDGWSGNLNYLQRARGYYLNISNADFEFKWGFGNCSQPPENNLPKTVEDPFAAIPAEFRFIQSTQQAFYLIKDINLNNHMVEDGDLILVYNDQVLAGSAVWSGKFTSVPVMGKDFSGRTAGYFEPGNVPEFKLFRNSTNEILPLDGEVDSWYNLSVSTLETLNGASKGIPSERLLKSVHPNPFNPSTRIQFQMPEEGSVSLTVYDIDGHEVETLVNQLLPAGLHEVTWTADGLPSGIYFAKLATVGRIEHLKLMLVK